MANLTAERGTIRLGDDAVVALPDWPMAAAKIVYAGLLAGLNSSGQLVDGGDGTCVQVIGVADKTVDNTSGGAGAVWAAVRRGEHLFDNSTANPVLQASAYLTTGKAEDNHTICVAAGTGVAIKGRLMGIDMNSTQVRVEFF